MKCESSQGCFTASSWPRCRLDMINKKNKCKWLYVIVPCHPQQDGRYSNHCFCTLWMLNMCLLFCDNKGRRGRQTGVSLLIFFPLNNWTKVKESKDTRRESRQIQEAVKRTTIKHWLGNYLSAIRPSCFEYQRNSNSQTNPERMTNSVLCQTIAHWSTGYTFEPAHWRWDEAQILISASLQW